MASAPVDQVIKWMSRVSSLEDWKISTEKLFPMLYLEDRFMRIKKIKNKIKK